MLHTEYIFEKDSFIFKEKLKMAHKAGGSGIVKIKVFQPVWSDQDRSMMHSGYVTYQVGMQAPASGQEEIVTYETR